MNKTSKTNPLKKSMDFRARRSRKRSGKKKNRHPLLLLLLLVSFFSIYGACQVHASRNGLTAESIISEGFRDDGDTSEWPFSPRYPTNTASTTIYRDRKIYLQLYSCTWKKSASSPNYMLRYFISRSDGTVIWFPAQDQGAFLNDWSNVGYIGGIALHKIFWMSPMEISGARPNAPVVRFQDLPDFQIRADFSGSANAAGGSYHYDYESYRKGSGRRTFIPEGGTAVDVPDYITAFHYRIDTSSGNVPLSGFTKLTTGDCSGSVRSLSLSVPSAYVNSGTQYYLHTVAESYTGQLSGQTTVPIPIRGVHTLSYDLNGGSGSFPDQTIRYGSSASVYAHLPTRTGYTFTGWTDPEGTVYQAGSPYVRRQNGGRVTLTANWRPNVYRFIYEPNGKAGENGEISGTMTAEEKNYTEKGIPDGAFQNKSLQDDGCPLFRFTGWSLSPEASAPDWRKEPNGSNDFQNVSVREITDALGLSDQDGSEIHLYAFWDKAPEFSGEKEFFFNRPPDKEEILSLISASDREDSPGEPLKKETGTDRSRASEWTEEDAGKILLLDFDEESLSLPGQCGYADVWIRASDSGGNTADRSLRIWTLSDGPIREPDGSEQDLYVRYIDRDNYKKSASQGGLMENSIWRHDDSYKELLDTLFAGDGGNT